MSEVLRDKIITAIRAATWPTNDDQVEGVEEAADAIMALIAEEGLFAIRDHFILLGGKYLPRQKPPTAP